MPQLTSRPTDGSRRVEAIKQYPSSQLLICHLSNVCCFPVVLKQTDCKSETWLSELLRQQSNPPARPLSCRSLESSQWLNRKQRTLHGPMREQRHAAKCFPTTHSLVWYILSVHLFVLAPVNQSSRCECYNFPFLSYLLSNAHSQLLCINKLFSHCHRCIWRFEANCIFYICVKYKKKHTFLETSRVHLPQLVPWHLDSLLIKNKTTACPLLSACETANLLKTAKWSCTAHWCENKNNSCFVWLGNPIFPMTASLVAHR